MPLGSTSALPFGVSPVLAGAICAKAVETMRTVLTSRTPALLIIGSFLSARGFTSGRTPDPANYSEKIRDLVPSRGNKTETTRVLARAMSQAGELHGEERRGSDAQGHRWPCCRHRARLQLLTSIAECKDHIDRGKPGQMADQSARSLFQGQKCSTKSRMLRTVPISSH